MPVVKLPLVARTWLNGKPNASTFSPCLAPKRSAATRAGFAFTFRSARSFVVSLATSRPVSKFPPNADLDFHAVLDDVGVGNNDPVVRYEYARARTAVRLRLLRSPAGAGLRLWIRSRRLSRFGRPRLDGKRIGERSPARRRIEGPRDQSGDAFDMGVRCGMAPVKG